MTVPVTVGDKEYHFIVDTGADVTVFDTELKSVLGSPLDKRSFKTSSASVETEVFMAPKIHVGRMPVAVNGRVACVPLGDMRKVFGQELFGFLGMDVLSQYAMRFDFDRGKLTFLKEVGREGGRRISLPHRRIPVIHLQFHGISQLPFWIDTGDIGLDSGNLNSSLVSWLEDNSTIRIVGRTKNTEASGTFWMRQGLVHNCTFAGHKCSNTLWSEQADHSPNHVSLRFLTQFNVTFDFPNAVMYLTKSKHFGRTDGVNLSGLHFRRVDGRVVIEVVDEGSVAEDCGIQAGDVIKTVGEQDVSTARLFALRNSFCQPGASIRMVLERGTETFEKELVLPGSPIAHNTKSLEAAR